MPSPHSLYGLRVILIVPVYFYMNMNCFGLVHVVSSWLQIGLLAEDSFGWLWMVSGGCGGFQVVLDGFGWFAVLVATILYQWIKFQCRTFFFLKILNKMCY